MATFDTRIKFCIMQRDGAALHAALMDLEAKINEAPDVAVLALRDMWLDYHNVIARTQEGLKKYQDPNDRKEESMKLAGCKLEVDTFFVRIAQRLK